MPQAIGTRPRIVLMLVIPLWRDVHFYCIHRLIHWGKLYDWVHELHHRNVNPGPWSGLAMHPVESIFYFSSVVLLWVVPAHPFHVLFLLQNMAFSASHGHAGFDRLGDDEHGLNTEVYMHYLHHKYFEVNYGSLGLVPIDQWFGTDHDGTPEADARMNARMMKLAEKRAAKIKS
jgi:sterol desaturase/sphingolipid hydroxylase (fatty acid hydroxylase superfamily)